MAATKRPSPCLNCKNENEKTCNHGYECEEWKRWFCNEWKRLKALLKVPTRKLNAWRYYHPDEVRRIVNHSPCDTCLRKECDTPCPSYICWYNMRIEIARKKAGL